MLVRVSSRAGQSLFYQFSRREIRGTNLENTQNEESIRPLSFVKSSSQVRSALGQVFLGDVPPVNGRGVDFQAVPGVRSIFMPGLEGSQGLI